MKGGYIENKPLENFLDSDCHPAMTKYINDRIAKADKNFAMSVDEISVLKAKHKAELSRHIEQISADFRQHGIEASIEVVTLEIDSMGEPTKYAYNVDITLNI